MQFDFVRILTDPFVLMFAAVATGLLFGKIRLGKFSFGASGALFTGLAIGWGISEFGQAVLAQGEETPGYAAAAGMFQDGIIHTHFFNAALILFVASVGLLAAKDMGVVLRKYGVRFVVLGILITAVGAGATYGAAIITPASNSYEVAGVYTGALTSSPGLGAALETSGVRSREYAGNYELQSQQVQEQILLLIDPDGALTPENTAELTPGQKQTYITNAQASVSIGYAIGYPFGVIVVIFAMNFFPLIFRMNVEEEKRRYREEMAAARQMAPGKELPLAPFSIISFSLACLIGYLVGGLEVYLGPLGYFSLGSTGGVLIVSLALGCVGKIGPLSFRMETKPLSLLREIGMVFFLAIVGLKYGFRAVDALLGSGLMLAAISLVVGTVAMLVGFVLGRYIFKLNWVMLAGALCGGMTSTPGLGAAIDALDSDDPAAGYGATYPFALLGMILFTIILHKLPIL